MMQNIIIVAGGKGVRMNSDIPKQFIEINKLPVLMHTINNFYKINPKFNIIIILPNNEILQWNNLIKKYKFKINHTVEKGGKTRFNSVKNGLKTINNGLVAIHDGVRPIISKELINTGFKIAQKSGNAIPYIDITESIREITKNGNKITNRDKFKIIQTPQFFKTEIIKNAYNQRYKKIFTDDASVLESTGKKINLFYGLKQNIKITTQDDIEIAKFYLKNIKL